MDPCLGDGLGKKMNITYFFFFLSEEEEEEEEKDTDERSRAR